MIFWRIARMKWEKAISMLDILPLKLIIIVKRLQKE
jgi:hypothetical protein